MPKPRRDPADLLPLTPAAFHVLLSLAEGDKHGYAIIKEVARRSEGKVQLRAGTLYAVIRKFVEQGLLVESAARPDPALDDERRRYYRLTDRGRAVAMAEADRLAETLAQARVKLAPRKA